MSTKSWLLMAAALLFAACGDGSHEDEGDPIQPGADGGGGGGAVVAVDCAGAQLAGTVTTPGNRFEPATTRISVGQVVRFDPSVGHDAVSDTPDLFAVELGEAGCFRFDAAGSFGFRCVPHGFRGTIVVE
jgi:plastocyanin